MNTRNHTAVNGSQYQDKATYASPYCPGYADTSDPWFVRHEQIMDVALVPAPADAVALTVLSIILWGLV